MGYKKRNLENLVLSHFKPVYKKNNYLFELNKYFNKNTR